MKTKRMSAVMAVIIALELVGGQMGSITTYAAEPQQATETATQLEQETATEEVGETEEEIAEPEAETSAQTTGATIVKSGSCGDSSSNLTYTIDSDGVLTISGTGAIKQSAFEGNTEIKKLVLNKGITGIGGRAFYDCTELTGDLIIPQGVTIIGGSAFYGCDGLNGRLEIPDTVTTIKARAFLGCSGLTGDLIIPDSVTTIGYEAFWMCSGFNGRLQLSSKLQIISDSLFYKCSGLTGKLIIPNGVTTLEADAFWDCSGLTGDLIIPDSVTEIQGSVFKGCSGFNGRLVISNSVTDIMAYTFDDCSGLIGKLVIPDTVTHIGRVAFGGCRKLTGDLVIPDTVTSVDPSAFANCAGLSGVSIPDTVTSIGVGVFQDCAGLSEIILPEHWVGVNDYMFEGCSSLIRVIIPEGTTSIGKKAFAGCSGLTGDLRIPEGVERIEEYAFSGCSGLKGRLVLPQSLTYIGEYGFENCSGLTGELVLPEKLTYIGQYGFYNCSGFSGTLRISKSIDIKFLAFCDCSGIEHLALEDGMTQIGNDEFARMQGLKTVIIPKSVNTIGRNALSAYSNVRCVFLNKDLQLPEDDRIFSRPGEDENMIIRCYRNSTMHAAWDRNHNGTTSYFWIDWIIQWLVDTEDGVYSYQEQADGNHMLTWCYSTKQKLTLPTELEGRKLTMLSKEAFAECENLTSVTIPDEIAVIDVGAFTGCKTLQEIQVSDSHANYATEDGVLYDKDKTTLLYVPGGKPEYIIPKTVTAIADAALADCQDTKLGCYADSYGKEYLKKQGKPYTVVIGKDHVHKYGVTVEREATCTQSGVRRYTCPGCDGTYTEVIPAKGHTTYLTGQVAPTDTTDGYSGDEYCRSCNQTVKKGSVIPKRNGTKVTVKLSGNGGKAKKAVITCGYHEKYGTLPKAVRKGYSFKGWYTKKSGGTKVTAATKVKSLKTITLYAHWSKVSKPKTRPVKSLSGKNRKFTVKYGKASGADGYQIQYGTKRTFKKAVTKLTKKTTYTSGRLKKNKVYYVRVRAYKTDSAQNKVYGKWSNVKKIKL